MENTTTKGIPIIKGTVQTLPKAKDTSVGGTMSSLMLNMSIVNNEISPWGKDLHKRDQQLANFWMSEPYLASAVHAISMTRSALKWQLTGPPSVVDRTQKMLKRSDFNRGFSSLISKIVVDLLTRDQGSHIEYIRKPPQKGRRPESGEVIAINHLPASQCYHTGDPMKPLIFKDSDGKLHEMAWYQVSNLVEIPIPDEDNKNIQFCFVSRVLSVAQTIKTISTYIDEKVSGRFHKSISVIGGISQHDLESIQEKTALDSNNMGLQAFSKPIIMSTLDPSANVSSTTVDLASVPDGFDASQMIKDYILLLSMGSGVSQIDLGAPIFSSSLGSSEQSGTLVEKSRLKSLLLFMKTIENVLVNSMAIPPSVKFSYVDSDGDVEERVVEMQYRRAKTREVMINDNTITPAVARQLAVDTNDLSPVYLALLGDEDEATITINDNERVSESDVSDVKPLDTPVENEDVPIDVAEEASKWLTTMIFNSPTNAIVPIPKSQLQIFQVSLRNRLTKSTIFGTDDVWMDSVILDAARTAGIEPLSLTSRLPENYKLLVTKDKVSDNNGSIIYIKEYKKDTTVTIDMILEDLSFDNYEDKLKMILKMSGNKVKKSYIHEIDQLRYFQDIQLLRLKFTGLYYKNLAK